MKQKYKLTARFGPYGYLLPSILVFAVFLFYPFFKTIYLSLFKTNKLGQAKLFVGFENYKNLLTSASFRNSLMVTLIFVVIVVAGSMILGLIAAVLCNKAIPGIRFFSTSYALPMAIASSSAAMIFKIIQSDNIEDDVQEVYSRIFQNHSEFSETKLVELLSDSCTREEMLPLRYFPDPK